MVRDQLDAVSPPPDNWSDHGEIMAGVDAELAELNQRVRIILSLHEFVIELDAICWKQIGAGTVAGSEELYAVWSETIEKFQTASAAIIAKARPLTEKGYPLYGMANLRRLMLDAGDRLEMAALISTAKRLKSDAGTPAETPFDESILASVSKAGGPFRHVGNE